MGSRDSRLIGLLATALAVGMTFSSDASADSDGYYCVNSEYLAYQLGGASPIASNRLYIVPFGAGRGLGEPRIVELPNFQVHGIRCLDRQVEVASYWDTYHFMMDDALNVVEQGVVALAGEGELPAWASGQRNLGVLSGGPTMESQRVDLSINDRGSSYYLEIEVTSSSDRSCIERIESKLLEVSPDGTVTDSRAIYAGDGVPSC